MPAPEALLDSNVLVAAVAPTHEHHAPSVALFADGARYRFAVAAHSYAEAFVTLTKQGAAAAFRWAAADAVIALDSLSAWTVLVGLTPAQTVDALRRYAETGGIGARVYDHLIGAAAVEAGVRRIVTWNVGHMRGLFPALEVVTPAEVR